MNEEINYIFADENDSSEGMGAVLWIVASLAVIALTVFSIIILGR